MATYGDLNEGSYYLVQEHENTPVEMVFVAMATEKCVMIEYQDHEQSKRWFKKTDSLLELIEKLTDEQSVIYESLLNSEEDDASDFDNNGDLIPWFKNNDETGEDDAIKN